MAYREDFHWVGTDEPHNTRRKEILKKHPEIRQLMGPDPKSKYICVALVASQLVAAYAVREKSWYVILATAYFFGGVVNHALELAIHELSHNLMFKSILHNRLFSLFCNIPMVVPTAITFKKYHIEHHKYQGSDTIDVDIPTALEARIFRGGPLKFVWLCLQVVWYALRPVFVRPKNPDMWEAVNWAACLVFGFLTYRVTGPYGILYLLICDLIGLGLHPTAGHFIAEHYVYTQDHETYSYYGPLNAVMFNVGYHNEHHDFPNIPGSRLHKVRKIAPEFYDTLPHYNSYTSVLCQFVTDPAIGLFSRVKREAKAL